MMVTLAAAAMTMQHSGTTRATISMWMISMAPALTMMTTAMAVFRYRPFNDCAPKWRRAVCKSIRIESARIRMRMRMWRQVIATVRVAAVTIRGSGDHRRRWRPSDRFACANCVVYAHANCLNHD